MTSLTGNLAATVVAASLFLGTGVANAFDDPTRPMDYSPPTGGRAKSERSYGPVLQSTVVSPLRKRAVIDGKAVVIGDKVNDARVVDIRPYEVILRRGDRDTSLRLMPKLGKDTKLAKEKGESE